MNCRLCSWIWVTAWNRLTTRPMTRPTSSTGPAILSASVMACVARLTTVSWFISASVEARHQRAGYQVPPVDQDEQQDLERQRDEGRRKHDHPHAHQGRRDDQVDD